MDVSALAGKVFTQQETLCIHPAIVERLLKVRWKVQMSHVEIAPIL